ncbi:MAG: RNA methyltransferase [Bacteroidetes bacterium]|nr:RNA methyltransferase [Bacteroidota bacterium]MBS1932111.1 RNA methyltransferase [Bacteroidota bacterium]
MLVKSKLKYIQSLGHKKPRDEAGVFIAEGTKLVKELLEEQPASVLEVFALKEWLDAHSKLLTKSKTEEITPIELGRISQLSTPNKVLAVIKQFSSSFPATAIGKIVLALDGIQDPGNLGTMIRNADWFGIEQIVCSPECADIYSPKVVQATMGSIARVKTFYVDLKSWMINQKGVRIYAAVLEGLDIYTMKKIKEGIILIGNESKGIREELLNMANVKITIPRRGKAESLNASVAAGVILGQLV